MTNKVGYALEFNMRYECVVVVETADACTPEAQASWEEFAERNLQYTVAAAQNIGTFTWWFGTVSDDKHTWYTIDHDITRFTDGPTHKVEFLSVLSYVE